jgi:hypothetical protein
VETVIKADMIGSWNRSSSWCRERQLEGHREGQGRRRLQGPAGFNQS